jgi:transcriptional regulator with XRE-family HTH domain
MLKSTVYKYIFYTNILRMLQEQGMTKQDLSDKSGVSISFLSDLTTGKANPSLKVMELISEALDVPLPLLLESSDMDRESLTALAGGRVPQSSLPPGFERVSAVLPDFQAYQVKIWALAAQTRLRRP